MENQCQLKNLIKNLYIISSHKKYYIFNKYFDKFIDLKLALNDRINYS